MPKAERRSRCPRVMSTSPEDLGLLSAAKGSGSIGASRESSRIRSAFKLRTFDFPEAIELSLSQW